MAADTISSLGGWTVSAALNAGLLLNYYERPGLKSFCTNLGNGAGRGSLTFQVPVYNWGSDTFAAHTEAGSITADSLADASFNVVLAQQVLDHQLSDEAMFVLDGAAWSNFIQERSMLFADQADNRISALICDLFDDFTQTVGTAGDQLTVDDMMLARAQMDALGGSGQSYAVLHPTQYDQLYASMRAETMDGLFHPAVAGLGKYGVVKGTICSDTVIATTNLVGTVSSNYRGAIFRPDAFGYKHGTPNGLSVWAPNAKVMPVSEGEVAAWLAANRNVQVDQRQLQLIAQLQGAMMSGALPELYVETVRDATIGTREVRLAASMFVGVGQQVGRGFSIRSTT